jgi:hypothetical protein
MSTSFSSAASAVLALALSLTPHRVRRGQCQEESDVCQPSLLRADKASAVAQHKDSGDVPDQEWREWRRLCRSAAGRARLADEDAREASIVLRWLFTNDYIERGLLKLARINTKIFGVSWVYKIKMMSMIVTRLCHGLGWSKRATGNSKAYITLSRFRRPFL